MQGVGNFATILPQNWQRPLRNRKNWTGLTTFTQIPSFHLVKKIVKIGPVDPEIALLIFKKERNYGR